MMMKAVVAGRSRIDPNMLAPPTVQSSSCSGLGSHSGKRKRTREPVFIAQFAGRSTQDCSISFVLRSVPSIASLRTGIDKR